MLKFAINHFKSDDPVLHSYSHLLEDVDDLLPLPADKYLSQLCREIVHQQLSNKVGRILFSRFTALFDEENITAERILALQHKEIRAIGLSNSKATYIQSIARAVTDGTLSFSNYENWNDEEIIQNLIQVKGIGRWTAEMFLLFTMGRTDIFSFGDLGLKKGIMRIYELDELPSMQKIAQIIEPWSPYKSYASLILWRSLDSVE